MSEPRTTIARATGRSALPATQLISRIIDAPLPDQFFDWLALKGVAAVEGQVAPWRTVGQERVLRMTDGSITMERLIAYDPGRGWTNVLSGFSNRVKHMLVQVEDDWAFSEDEQGTAVTWTWTFHPRATALGKALTFGMVAPLHRPYLQGILDRNLLWAEAEASRTGLVTS